MGVPEPLWFTVHLPERDDLNHWRERARATRAERARDALADALEAEHRRFADLERVVREVLPVINQAAVTLEDLGEPGECAEELHAARAALSARLRELEEGA